MKEDPRVDVCQHRHVASYLHWVWNHKLNCRSPFFNMQLPFSTFRICLFARIMMSRIPIFLSRTRPIQSRKCKLCQQGPGDFCHLLLECPQFQYLRDSYFSNIGYPTQVSHIFQSKNPAHFHFMAEVLQNYYSWSKRTTHTFGHYALEQI